MPTRGSAEGRLAMLLPGYDVTKAAQAVAYLALKAGGKINVLKLSKLLYLAEREFMSLYDEPMFFDRLVSMPDGPVVSITLNLINGNAEDEVWQQYVAPRQGYDVAATKEFSADDFEDLSLADREVLDNLWAKFGGFDKYKLRDWTHKKENIPEWEDPSGSSYSISHAKVFESLGKDDAGELVRQIEERRIIAQKLASM